MRKTQSNLAPVQMETLFDDFQPLIEQLGSPSGLTLAGVGDASLQLDNVKTFSELRKFLQNYLAQLLAPVELPLICAAYSLASRNQFAELIELDKKLATDSRFEKFASASQRVGRVQLKRLRPLRDQRGLQRYIRAVDANEVFAWHTLVYGVMLASFSVPLRQGLFGYCEQVIAGFVNAAEQRINFSETDGQNLVDEICAAVPKSIEQVLGANVNSATPLIRVA